MADDESYGLSRAGFRGIVDEVDRFATAEAVRSGLPGRLNGPADAYRHIVALAQLTRRLGAMPALAVGEINERRNWIAQGVAIIRGHERPTSLSRASRDLDRHNNEVGMRIGARARTTEDVVAAARAEIERAAQIGPGRAGRATWMPVAQWDRNPPASDWNWPPRAWPPLEASDHFNAYPGRDAPSIYERRRHIGAGGAVQVAPHIRDGHAVRGHTRAAPAR